jgi:hypothetical protein
MHIRKKIIPLFLFGSCFGIVAQESDTVPEMVTDRPDATESPSTVPKGFLQVETGTLYESFESGDVLTESYTYNTTLARYGILNNMEFRVGWDFQEIRTTVGDIETENVQSGFSPLLLGMKVAIREEKGCLPEIGFLGHLMLPFTAASDYRPETTGVDFRFSLAHTLSPRSSIGYNLGAQWGNDSPEAAYVYTLAYGYAISDAWALYAEVYGDLPEDNRANHYWDTGVTWLITNNIQLDATIGRSFTEGQDLLLSTGLSFRIPK